MASQLVTETILSTCLILSASRLLAGDRGLITSETRANLIRTLGSEFVALKVPLPINKMGLTVNAKGEFDWKRNEEESIRAGQFIAPGITVQVTNITFDDNKITFEINGGGRKKKKRFLERIKVGAGGGTRPLA